MALGGSAIAAIDASHYPGVLELNAGVVEKTGPLDEARLAWMVSEAFQAVTIGGGADAFLIAFAEGAAYDSPNYLWFAARYPRFVYVDRIVVAEHARGHGLARRLYEDLMAHTRASGRTVLTCEVNRAPPNPGSDAFHAALGFFEVGRATFPSGKAVRYLARDVS